VILDLLLGLVYLVVLVLVATVPAVLGLAVVFYVRDCIAGRS